MPRTDIVVRLSLPKRAPVDLVIDRITGKTTLGQVRERLLALAASHADIDVRSHLTAWAPRGRLSSNPGFDDDRKTLAAVWGAVWKQKYGNTMLELLDCNLPSNEEDAGGSATAGGVPRPVTSWEELASSYDGFIFDQFGVMHNGATALEGAPALVARLAAAGKKLGILSNSSKRKEWTLRELPKLGFSAEHFVAAAVTTSGEEAWHALGDAWRGKACVWLSKADGDGVSGYLDGTGVSLADVERADFLLASGTNVVRDGASVTPVDCEQSGDLAPFEPLFSRAVARGLPMVCANPDFVSPPKPGKAATYQPGHLAARYEQLGGRVIYYGKPHREHFEACVAGLGLPKERVAHVGDSVHHDVAGASAAAMPVIFVAGGIEHEALGIRPGELPPREAVRRLCEEHGTQQPTHTVALVAWEAHVM